jgi:hypothetical protein
VILDIGAVSDIGLGSEFVSVPLAAGEKVTLRITEAEGVDRSIGTVVSPAGAKVAAKDVFELAKWIPAKKPNLYFWVPVSQLTQAQITAAVSEARLSGVRLVNDPSREAWSHLISWDGSQWTLQKAGVRGADPLAATLTADLIKRKLPRDAVVWLNLPPAAEVSTLLLRNDPTSAAQTTASEVQAMYVLAGTVTDSGPAYTWYNRGELIAGRQTPAGYGNGCSADSPYPIRTEWASGVDTAATLTQFAARLAKLNGWIQLLQSGAAGGSDYPYHLSLLREADSTTAEDKGKTHADDVYQIMLQARGDTRADPRWVYVLAIDCQGKGDLMFPQQGGNNRYPLEAGRLDQIRLPGARFKILPPFGTDTYVLLSTSTQLANPDALSFERVTRGPLKEASSPVEMLLISTSAGEQGVTLETPTDWGVEYLQTHSQPQKAP